MTQLPQSSLTQLIRNSDDKEHALLSWVTDHLSKADSPNLETAEAICHELNELLKSMAEDQELCVGLAVVLCEQISSLYMACFKTLKPVKGSQIYDTALYLSNLLCEDDITKSKAKKKNKSRSYIHSPTKLASVVALERIVSCYAQELTSLLPPLLPEILKNVKKTIEKDKYMHAVFLTKLMQLVAIIYKNLSKVDSTVTAKYVKTFKVILEHLKLDKQAYPAPFVGAVITTYGQFYKDLQFLESQSSSNHFESFKTKFFHNGYGLYGISNDDLRLETCVCLADVMHDWSTQKELITLDDVLSFLSDIFVTVENRSSKAATFETLAHFLGLSMTSKNNLLASGRYLDVISKLALFIFESPKIKNQKLDHISRCIAFFDMLHRLVLRYVTESSQLLMLFSLFDCDKDNTMGLLEDKEGEVLFSTIVFLHLGTALMENLSSTFTSNNRNTLVIKNKLFELSTSNNFQIRVHGSKALQVFLTCVPNFLPEVLGSSLEQLSKELFATASFSFSKCHSYTFILASLVEVASPQYVPSELIMREMIFATTILKDHPPSNGLGSYYKQLIAWILLCGLMNYKDVDFLRIQSSQLFLFWKSILTHSYYYKDEDELYKNIELRNHALACLLSYLERISIDADIAKQVSFLLTKCSAYNNSIQLKTKTIDNILLQNENRILQVYLKIHDFVKYDFNSAILILIVKNFADPNLYCEPPQSLLNRMSGNQDASSKEDKSPCDNLSLAALLSDDSGFAYGLSSKIHDFDIDELKIKTGGDIIIKSLEPWKGRTDYWFSCFEAEILKPITSVLSYDCLIMLYGPGGYSKNEVCSPRVTTSIINSSVEVFSLIFPFLNDKIQYSVLESMNSCVFSKNTISMRSIAIALNCCVAIYGALLVVQRNNIKLREPVANLLLKILKGIPFNSSEFTVRLKAECVGLILSTTERIVEDGLTDEMEFANSVSEVIVKDIFVHDDPFSRIFNALSISCVFKYKRQNFHFSTALELLENLIKDPHPIVHTWSLEALSILIEGVHSLDIATSSKLLHLLESIANDGNYGKNSSNVWSINYSHRYNSHRTIGKIILSITQLLGPEIKLLSSRSFAAYKNLLFTQLGAQDVIENTYGILTTTNLAAFKLIQDFGLNAITTSAATLIRQALSIDLAQSEYRGIFASTEVEAAGPFNDSAVGVSFQLINQLARLEMLNQSFQGLENLIWSYFSVFPDSKFVQSFVKEWFDHTYSEDLSWVDRLYNIFFISAQQLALLEYKSRSSYFESSSIENNEGGDSKEVDIIDNEKKTFTAGHTSATKVDHLPWKMRLFILNLLRELFLLSTSSKNIKDCLQKKLSKMTKICFSASTMNIPEVKKVGIELLGLVIEAFPTSCDDPCYQLLEDEEAHIVSALMPAFGKSSTPSILPTAITVCTRYLSSNPTSLQRNTRITNILITSLAELVEKPETLLIGEVSVCTQKGKSEIEISVLNAWAHLTIEAITKRNVILLDFVKTYLNTLTPLWVIMLREFVSVQNSKTSTGRLRTQDILLGEAKNYENCEHVWLNIAHAISSVHAFDSAILSFCLKAGDLQNFVFVIYAQCLQHLTLTFEEKGTKTKTLNVIHSLLAIGVPSELLFSDDILEETVEIFERIVLTGKCQEKTCLVYVIEGLVSEYLNSYGVEDQFISGAEKVYLLLRVLMMIITSKLPFLKTELQVEKDDVLDAQILDAVDQRLLKNCFSSVAHLVCRFPADFRMDLNACLLFIVGRIMRCSQREVLVSSVLPLLKEIVSVKEPTDAEIGLVTVFFEANKHFIFHKLPKDFAVATVLILSKFTATCFSDADIDSVAQVFYESLKADVDAEVTIVAFKSFLGQGSSSVAYKEVVRRIVLKLVSATTSRELLDQFGDYKVIMEILILFTQSCIEKQSGPTEPALALCLSAILNLYEKEVIDISVISDEITKLLQTDVEKSKKVFSDYLNDNQKALFSEIVTLTNGKPNILSSETERGIELKRFI